MHVRSSKLSEVVNSGPGTVTPARKLSDRAARIVELCRGKRVLHIGCADQLFTDQKFLDGTLLHALVSAVAEESYGIDPSAESVAALERHGYRNLTIGTVQEVAKKGLLDSVQFDVLLAGEVLEHVPDAAGFLAGMRQFLGVPSSRLILTTPNAFCAYRFVHRMLGGSELVNCDHVAYYSPSTLTTLLRKCGYELESLSFYSAREFVSNRGWGRILRLVDGVAYRFRPELCDGLIAVARVAGCSVTGYSYSPDCRMVTGDS